MKFACGPTCQHLQQISIHVLRYEVLGQVDDVGSNAYYGSDRNINSTVQGRLSSMLVSLQNRVSQYVVYDVAVEAEAQKWTKRLRFSDFSALLEILQARYNNIPVDLFPRKTMVRSVEPEHLAQRVRQLNEFLLVLTRNRLDILRTCAELGTDAQLLYINLLGGALAREAFPALLSTLEDPFYGMKDFSLCGDLLLLATNDYSIQSKVSVVAEGGLRGTSWRAGTTSTAAEQGQQSDLHLQGGNPNRANSGSASSAAGTPSTATPFRVSVYRSEDRPLGALTCYKGSADFRFEQKWRVHFRSQIFSFCAFGNYAFCGLKDGTVGYGVLKVEDGPDTASTNSNTVDALLPGLNHAASVAAIAACGTREPAPAGVVLYTGSLDGKISVYEIQKKRVVAELLLPSGDAGGQVGPMVATAYYATVMKVFDRFLFVGTNLGSVVVFVGVGSSTLQLHCTLMADQNRDVNALGLDALWKSPVAVRDILISDQRPFTRIFVANRDGVQIWQFPECRQIGYQSKNRVPLDNTPIRSIALREETQELLLAFEDGTVKTVASYDLETSHQLTVFKAHFLGGIPGRGGGPAGIMPNASEGLTSLQQQGANVASISRGYLRGGMECGTSACAITTPSPITRIQCVPEGDYLISCGKLDRCLKIWRCPEGETVKRNAEQQAMEALQWEIERSRATPSQSTLMSDRRGGGVGSRLAGGAGEGDGREGAASLAVTEEYIG
eukprot:g2208.t1